MAAFGEEIESFKNELETTLVGRKDGVVQFGEQDDHPNYNHYQSGQGWITDGWRWSFPAKRRTIGRGPRPRVGTLSVVADLRRAGRPATVLGFPCFIVAWARKGDDWSEDIDFTPTFWPAAEADYELRGERLFWWVNDENKEERRRSSPLEASWFFIMPIVAVDGPGKLRELIVQPVYQLLNFDRPEVKGEVGRDVLANNREILRFRWVDGIALLA
jgi:hypothetical protein